MTTPKKTKPRARALRVEQQEFVPGIPKTQQHFREEVDINNIVAKFKRTGMVPSINENPQYGDISSLDFLHMQNAVVDMKNRFMRLPGKTRARFNNDPHQMLRFIEDPENHDDAVKLGLLRKKPKAPTPTPTSEAKAPENAPEGPK